MTAARAAAAVRAGIGATMLLRPGAVASALGAPVSGAHPVLRVLGLRHVVQSAALLSAPSRANATSAAVVDATHVASCLGFAAVRGSSRRPVLREAALESAILTTTWLTRPRA